MKSLIVLIFSFPSLVTVFCAHCREKEVFERVCSFPCHNWTRLALIFMMFWWYGRPAMRLISCITGIHSSFGWLTHNVGEFYAPSSGHRIHSGGIYFGNDRAVASRTQLIVVEAQSERSWRTTWHVSKSASHLSLDERARSSKPTTDQGCKHMAHERCGPRFVLRGTDFTKVAVSEVSPTVSSGRPSQQGHHRVMGFSPDWCEAVTVSRHVRLDDFHPSEEALTSRSRYSSTVSQSRALRCSVFGWWWEAKWKLNDTVHCFHLNVPFQVFGFIAFMMAVNQTPGLNLNMECYLLWEQLHWWTGRCVCRATSSELNLYRFYHSALHISVILANADKMKVTRFKK